MSFKPPIFTTSEDCAAAHVLPDPRRDWRRPPGSSTSTLDDTQSGEQSDGVDE